MLVIKGHVSKILRDDYGRDAKRMADPQFIVHIWIFSRNVGYDDARSPDLVPDVVDYRPGTIYFVCFSDFKTGCFCSRLNDFVVVAVKRWPKGHKDEGQTGVDAWAVNHWFNDTRRILLNERRVGRVEERREKQIPPLRSG